MSEGPSEPQAIWADSHCHLQDLADPLAVLDRAVAAGVRYTICIGTDLASSRSAITFAQTASGAGTSVWLTIGLHPHEAKDGTAEIQRLAEEAFEASKSDEHAPGSVVAIGECGLDYYYEHSPRDAQRVAFAEQIALAKRLDATLVVHTRDAWDETIDVLSAKGVPQKTVIHCFSGGETEARRCLDLGTFLSFSGIVTFKNAHAVRAAALLCPIERLLIETDAPFLAPVPVRGEANEPSFLPYVGLSIAELRGIQPEEFAAKTTRNAALAFSLQI